MACHWFANVNKDDSNIKLCRYRSFCRYFHFTKKEVELYVSQGLNLIDCEKCAWKLKPFPEDLSWSDEIQERARRQMPCIYCNGGKTAVASMLKRRALDRDWCKCAGKTPTRLYDGDHPRYPRKLVTVCDICKCVVSYVD